MMNLYVGNLHEHMSETQLKRLFMKFGHVKAVKIVMDKSNGRSMKFGFVQMEGWEDGQRAIAKLNRQNFMNQYLEVREIPYKRGFYRISAGRPGNNKIK